VKVGIVITNNYTKNLRPDGRDLLNRLLKSIVDHVSFEYKIFIVDNGSDTKLDFLGNKIIHYTYIEDQFERGLTGAWNEGIKEASRAGCDIILNSNDDLVFNETINDFVAYIQDNKFSDMSVFGPLTNGVESPYLLTQYSEKPNPLMTREILNEKKSDGLINGFFFGFTNNFYKKFMYDNGDLFAEFNKFDKDYILNHAFADGKWGGQEGEFFRWKELGAKVFVVGECWIDHLKKKDWYVARCFSEEFGWHLDEGCQNE
jgi:GT2 family glycosyltransferase